MSAVTGASPAPLAGPIKRLSIALLGANLVAWLWAFVAFHNQPVLLGTALLAWVLGLRHAIDPDHIAAIDNVTRKLMQDGQQPLSVGLWFALGHSTIVMIAAAALAASAAKLKESFEAFAEIGGIIGPAVSTAFLLLIGLLNLAVLLSVWSAWRHARRTRLSDAQATGQHLIARGFLSRLLRPLFGFISKPWHMYPLGFLFALGFDTATTISLFGVSAANMSEGVGLWQIMAFPLLFTAGMVLADAADGVMMVGAYGWAFVDPARKLAYNLAITAISVLVAFLIGGLQAFALLREHLDLSGRFWDGIASLNEEMALLGFVMVGVFALGWLGSALIARRNSAALEAKIEA